MTAYRHPMVLPSPFRLLPLAGERDSIHRAYDNGPGRLTGRCDLCGGAAEGLLEDRQLLIYDWQSVADLTNDPPWCTSVLVWPAMGLYTPDGEILAWTGTGWRLKARPFIPRLPVISQPPPGH